MRDITWQTTTAGFLDRLASAWRHVLLGIADGLAAAHRYERLAVMSDAELARLGLTREDVPRFAFFGERPEPGGEQRPCSDRP